MIFDDGGEEGFVGRMVEESQHFQTRCKYVVNLFLYPFNLLNNDSYKVVHLDAREDVICGYYCRKLP